MAELEMMQRDGPSSVFFSLAILFILLILSIILL